MTAKKLNERKEDFYKPLKMLEEALKKRYIRWYYKYYNNIN